MIDLEELQRLADVRDMKLRLLLLSIRTTFFRLRIAELICHSIGSLTIPKIDYPELMFPYSGVAISQLMEIHKREAKDEQSE